MATRSPNVWRKSDATAGVSAISGTSISDAAAGVAHGGREPQVDLGLAAAGDAVQQRDVERARGGERGQPRERACLLRGRGAASGSVVAAS